MSLTIPAQVLDFWFVQTPPKMHFTKDPDFDALVTDNFSDLYRQVRMAELQSWLDTADGCLALLVVLDQAPRNMFRASPLAFATDAHARSVARHMLKLGFDLQIPARQRLLSYLPFEHSEYLDDQDLAVSKTLALNKALDGDDHRGHDYALRHHAIIAQFGRFPHRNSVLERRSSPEELDFLTKPGSSF